MRSAKEITGKALQQQAEEWSAMLAGAPVLLDLPVDRVHRADRGGRATRLPFSLAPGVSQRLREMAAVHGTDLERLMLAVWSLFLVRLANQEEVVVGLAPPATEGAPLAWGQAMPVRIDGAGSPTTFEFIARAVFAASALQARRAFSFDVIAASLGLPDDPSRHPLFQSALAWQANDASALAATSGTTDDFALDIAIALRDAGGGVSGEFLFADALFERSTGERYLRHWINLLAAVADNDLGPMDHLPLLDFDGQREMITRWNNIATAALSTACIHELFEQQVVLSPDATAVVHASGRLTYQELNTRANRLARHLRALGVVPEARVAIYMDRSPEMVVALLATLKAGAAYVPLDPMYPPERLAAMMEDGSPVAVLTEASLATAADALVSALSPAPPVLDLTMSSPPWQSLVTDNLPRSETDVSPTNLAYVIFTSGSTGRPKGVAMPHAPLVNLLQWQFRQSAFRPAPRTLQFAALGFDVAFQEIFSTLCAGGELHLIDHDRRLSAARLFEFIVERRIERLFLPYFALQILAEGLEERLATLTDGQHLDCALIEVITAGEQLRIEPRIARLFQHLPGCRLHNHYGPTESHVCTALALPADPASWPTLPSIGGPIDNTQIYILDAGGQPLPVGVAGELFVAGACVARGYLGREDLTAERFLADPFSADPGARMYRTGDLARWLGNGTIEFLGRKDFQVKVRGFRIELGEIEAQLLAFTGVRTAAVLAREDTPGLKRLVAYLVADGADIDIDGLRRQLIARLPDYMVPVAYVILPTLPLSANGKVDRKALPVPENKRPEWAGVYSAARGDVEQALCSAFADILDIDRVGRDDNFFDLGGTSLLAMRLLERVRRAGLGDIATTVLFAKPTAAELARSLSGAGDDADSASRLARGRSARLEDPIAIIAMAGRFPGASDVEAFWENLCEGKESITQFGREGLDASIDPTLANDPSYIAARGVIEGAELFDAAFFGIGPKQAELMDPQHRVFLELCWECLERGGHVPDATPHPVGVFAGMHNATYFQRHVMPRPDLIDKVGAFQVMLDNEKDYIATRVAHKLNLTGPAVSIHTACSTSLVAIVQAMDSLRAGRCDMALAGGVAIACPPNSGYLYQEGGMLSPDGHTRSFDAKAQGTVFSDGAAVLLLKRLSDARADGNPVIAVIRGGAINNDGGHKASFTAPSSEGQAAVVAMALADAQVDARSIGYVETHGTATPVGDPIEIEGLTRAFRRSTQDVGFCRVGSVKSNIGHVIAAAGATGTIKAALSLAEGVLPASLFFESANPLVAFEGSPFVVNAQQTPWPARSGAPRRAGVSSFGVGGTNAHIVLEEAPFLPASDTADGPQLLVLSARSGEALRQSAQRLADHLAHGDAAANLGDVAWTLAEGRKAFPHRLAIAAESVDDAIAQLRSPELDAAALRSRAPQASDVVFMFPGQGSHYAGMGRTLYDAEPAFRAAFDTCADLLAPELGVDLRTVAFGDDADALLPTSIMQPAIFSIEYSLARTWMALGVQPAALIGHSVGEFVAATLAGVFTLPDALRLVARRGALMQAQPTGAMLSVRLTVDDLMTRLPDSLSLAAENSASACVVAGTHEAIAAFQTQLEADGVACRLLKTSHAFHSAMMDDVVPRFRVEVASVERRAPSLPIVSTVSADWLDADRARSADYWATHLREPVRFASALARVLDASTRVLLEVGPRATLTLLARQHPALQAQKIVAVVSLADSPEKELASLRSALGQLWCQGISVAPSVVDRREKRRRVRLPTTPFQRQRFWVEAPSAATLSVPSTTSPFAPAAVAAPEISMSNTASATPAMPAAPVDRRPRLVAQLKDVFEDVAGFDLADADTEANFIELGLDSLMLTQVALQLQKTFGIKITFRQLMGDCASLGRLSRQLDSQLPADVSAAVPTTVAHAPVPPANTPLSMTGTMLPAISPMGMGAGGDTLRYVIDQQMQLMSQQLALLSGQAFAAPGAIAAASAAIIPNSQPLLSAAPSLHAPATAESADDEAATLAHTHYDVKKAFGAIARIDNAAKAELDPHQRGKLDAFMARYIARTGKSKAFTQEHRGHMADPRVVNGFRPLTKEIVYQIVIERSKGPRLWDIDGNEYVDALNGFGTSLFGWQPDFVIDAVKRQLELGYEIGPQHPLAGDVARLVCELTGNDRAALCNTGSEAVLGAMRVARTVTGRDTIVVFSGSYHGINDEVIVRGTKKLRAVPAAPGILPNTAEHVLVLDYGTPESLEIIRERAGELAAVLVEPVQSRRPDFQPVDFLREVRKITEAAGAVLIFDEVITGFRSHPGGTQALFGIRADLATYGKVVGGGYPIGVIAGKREYMDALDGGHWQYGDDSTPPAGVTYFAGTFVRHPLTLAAAKASLEHMKAKGADLQRGINERTTAMADELNTFCREHGCPIEIRHFASMWRTVFLEDHPLQDLIFAMMRSRGIHILDNFPCFFTSAHSEADFRRIIDSYKEAVLEMQDAGFLPRNAVAAQIKTMDAAKPVVPGARLGRDPDGRPAWFVPNPEQPGKFLKVGE